MVSSVFSEFISVLTSQALQDELFPAKVIFVFFGLAFFILLVYFVFNSSFLQRLFIGDIVDFFDIEPVGLRKIARRWKIIQKRVDVGTEYEYKLAVIEAEELFNDVLTDKGFPGKTFDERIREVEKVQLPNVEEILEAHKIRNMVAYDPNYKITKDEARKVLTVFEKGIRSIEAF